MTEPFSRREGFRGGGTPPPITIREGAPDELRAAVIQVARECGLAPSQQREVICQVLRKNPNPNNWSEDPNIWGEVRHLVSECPWFRVYDIGEALAARLPQFTMPPPPGNDVSPVAPATRYEEEINEVLIEHGVGWRLQDGRFLARGSEAFEHAVESARERATETGRPTASSEIAEALTDLSRRPTPDLTGAIHHAMAGLECLAREVVGDQRAARRNPQAALSPTCHPQTARSGRREGMGLCL